jgi:prepilin-type N-terminal cleavage/methylation domain-containing protein
MRHRSGFTLIELLVVIAVIAIIAAILFPVFAQAREKARAATCLSHARQIGLAYHLYAQDYDETLCPWQLPTGLRNDSALRGTNSWVHLLQPYLKNGEPPRIDNPSGGIPPVGIMRCPSFNAVEMQRVANLPGCDVGWLTARNWPPRHYWAHYGISYGAGVTGGNCTQVNPYYKLAGSGPSAQTRLAQINRPSETVVITDGFTAIMGDGTIGNGFGCEATNSHQGGGTHIFVDGHAKWIAGNSQTVLDRDAAGCWFWKYYTADR